MVTQIQTISQDFTPKKINSLDSIAFQYNPETNSHIAKDKKALVSQLASHRATWSLDIGIDKLIDYINRGKTVQPGINEVSASKDDILGYDFLYIDYDCWDKENNCPKPDAATIDELVNLPTIQKYCFFYQYSFSYRHNAPNSHFFFMLSRTVNTEEHHVISKYLTALLKEQIGLRKGFDAAVTNNPAQVCFSGKLPCIKLNDPQFILVDDVLKEAASLGFRISKPVISGTEISDNESDEKINKPLTHIYKQLIERFNGDWRLFYNLHDHQWIATTRNIPDDSIGQYDGQNPFSNTNSSGTSFSITAFKSSKPPVFLDRANSIKGDLIDYFYYYGRKQGLYQSGGIKGNFKVIVNKICSHFEITSFEWKKKEDSEDEESKRQRVVRKLIEEFGAESFSLNKMTFQPELNREQIDLDQNIFATTLDIEHKIITTNEMCINTVMYLCNKNPYHPVKEYLEAVHAKYGYQPGLIDNLSSKYFGTNKPIYDIYMRKTLMGAVARILKPGEHLKTVTVLSGAQDAGKSQWIKYLAGVDWFNDNLNLTDFDKDEKININRFWIHELSEIDKIVRRFDRANLKTNISSPSDNFRVPYGRKSDKHDRTAIFIGTTNDTQILTDPTGSVRFWCILVEKKAGEIDLEQLISERDRLWASAYHEVKILQNQFWLNKNEEAMRDEANILFQADDAIDEMIQIRTQGVESVSVAELMISCDWAVDNKGLQMRVTDYLKKEGFIKKRIQQVNRWLNPSFIKE